MAYVDFAGPYSEYYYLEPDLAAAAGSASQNTVLVLLFLLGGLFAAWSVWYNRCGPRRLRRNAPAHPPGHVEGYRSTLKATAPREPSLRPRQPRLRHPLASVSPPQPPSPGSWSEDDSFDLVDDATSEVASATATTASRHHRPQASQVPGPAVREPEQPEQPAPQAAVTTVDDSDDAATSAGPMVSEPAQLEQPAPRPGATTVTTVYLYASGTYFHAREDCPNGVNGSIAGIIGKLKARGVQNIDRTKLIANTPHPVTLGRARSLQKKPCTCVMHHRARLA